MHNQLIVYSLIHEGRDEIVVKCPIQNANKSIEEIYDGIIAESLFLNLVPHNKYICEIKEEIIELNQETN